MHIKKVIILGFFCFIFLLCSTAFARHPFPSSPDEYQKAEQIKKAIADDNQDSINILLDFLKDDNPRVQTAATLGLGKQAVKDLDIEEAIPILNELQYADKDYLRAAVKVTLILANQDIDTIKKQEKLIALMEVDDKFMRKMAIRGIKEIGNEKVLPFLPRKANETENYADDSYDVEPVAKVAFEVWWHIKSKSLNEEEERIEWLIDSLNLASPFGSPWGDAACKYLEKIGEPAIPHLLKAFKSKNRQEKLWSGKVLKNINAENIKDSLVETALKDLKNSDPVIRHMGMSILIQYGNEENIDLFINLLKNKHFYVRLATITTLGNLGGEKAVTSLLESLQDKNERVRTEAAYQLAKMGRKEGYETLYSSFGSKDTRVRKISLSALDYIDDNDKAYTKLMNLLEKKADEDKFKEKEKAKLAMIRVDIIQFLSKTGYKKVFPTLSLWKTLLKDDHSSVSRSTANLLRQLGFKVEWIYDSQKKQGSFELVEE